MMRRRRFIAAGGAAALGGGVAHAAAPGPGRTGMNFTVPQTTGTMEPRRTLAAPKLGWSYEVDVALPPNYAASKDKRYPVLWVTDGPQMFTLAAGLVGGLALDGLAPEMIVVAVGCPGEAGALEWVRRRNIEFVPPGPAYFWDGPQGEIFRGLLHGKEPAAGRADDFLAFLIDTARPALAADYRMSGDHGLFGHSGGGLFTTYALFARPGGFARYVIGSPSINAVDRACFKLEKAYAAAHKDLPAKVFFGAGEKEIADPTLAAWGIVSSATSMAETLRLRNYPSLQVATRIFPGKDHLSVIPDVIGEGVQSVWNDKGGAPAKPPG